MQKVLQNVLQKLLQAVLQKYCKTYRKSTASSTANNTAKRIANCIANIIASSIAKVLQEVSSSNQMDGQRILKDRYCTPAAKNASLNMAFCLRTVCWFLYVLDSPKLQTRDGKSIKGLARTDTSFAEEDS
jgi:hypothetical protein